MFHLNFSKLFKCSRSKQRGNSLTLLLTSATLMSLSMAITSVAVEGGNVTTSGETQQVELGTDTKLEDCLNGIENYVTRNKTAFLDSTQTNFNVTGNPTLPGVGPSLGLVASASPAGGSSSLTVNDVATSMGYTDLRKSETMTQGGTTRKVVTSLSSHAFSGAQNTSWPASVSKLTTAKNAFMATCQVQVDGGTPLVKYRLFTLEPDTGCQVTGTPTETPLVTGLTTGVRQPLPNTLLMGTNKICMLPGDSYSCNWDTSFTEIIPLLEARKDATTDSSGAAKYVVALVRTSSNAQVRIMTKGDSSGGTPTATTFLPVSPLLAKDIPVRDVQVYSYAPGKFRILTTYVDSAPQEKKIVGWNVSMSSTPSFSLLSSNGTSNVTALTTSSMSSAYTNGKVSLVTEIGLSDMTESDDSFVYVGSQNRAYWSKASGYDTDGRTTTPRLMYSRELSLANSTQKASLEMSDVNDSPVKDIAGLTKFGAMTASTDGKFIVMPVMLQSGMVGIAALDTEAYSAINSTNQFPTSKTATTPAGYNNLATLMTFNNTAAGAVNPAITSMDSVRIWFSPAMNKFYWMVSGGARVYEWDPTTWGRGNSSGMATLPGQTMTIGSVVTTGSAPTYTGTSKMQTVRVFQADSTSTTTGLGALLTSGLGLTNGLWSSGATTPPEMVFNPIQNEYYIRDLNSTTPAIIRFNPAQGIFKPIISGGSGTLIGPTMAFDTNRGWLVYLTKSSATGANLTYNLMAWDPLKPDVEISMKSNITMGYTAAIQPAVFYNDNARYPMYTSVTGTASTTYQMSAIVPKCAMAQ